MSFSSRQLIAADLAKIYPKVSDKISTIFGKTVLVTGGAGFVGSWVCELVSYLNREQNAGIKLYILDRARDVFTKRLSHLIDQEFIEFIRCDVRSLTEIPSDVNYIIHAAASPDSRFHASNPIETMTTIAEGTANILRAANRVSNLIKFLNISSSAVYSSSSAPYSLPESSEGLSLSANSLSAYSESKRYAEQLCAAVRSEARIPIVTVRPFTFCGPYQDIDAPWFINNFINDALHKRAIRILGDGKSTRSLMYGADLAYWLLVAMVHGTSGQVFNIGSDRGETLDTLANRVAASFIPSPGILTNTSLAGTVENTHLVPDISIARAVLGLDIYTDTDQAIARTIDWYREIQTAHSR